MVQDGPLNVFNSNLGVDFRFFVRLHDGRGLLSCHSLNVVLVVDCVGDVVGRLSDGISRPEGIAVNGKGLIHVVDRHKNCIHVFNDDLSYRRSIFLDAPGSLNQPVGIAISGVDDKIYVADNENHRVLVLSAEGDHVHTFGGGGHGTAPGQFFCPCGVALFDHPIHGELVIVSEWGGGRVQVFHVTGALFALYGGVSHAHDVVVDSDGMVYVSEYSNRKIKRFSLDGAILGGGEWGGSVVSLVAENNGLHSVVMRDRVVSVLKDCKKRKRNASSSAASLWHPDGGCLDIRVHRDESDTVCGVD